MSKEITEVIPCGTLIRIKTPNLEGMITGKEISFKNITYKITYFLGGEHKIIWLNEQEFTSIDSEKQQIGFKSK